MLTIQKVMITAATLSLLTACGGGGGSDDSIPETDTTTTSAPVSTTPITSGSTIQGTIPANPQSGTNTTSTNNQSSTTTGTSELPATSAVPEQPQLLEVTRTSELTADEDFGFTSSYDVNLFVELVNTADLYINVCHGFNDRSPSPEINYDTCILKAPLQTGQYTGKLSLTNDISQLVIAIWSFDGADPRYYFWDRSTQGNTILVN